MVYGFHTISIIIINIIIIITIIISEVGPHFSNVPFFLTINVFLYFERSAGNSDYHRFFPLSRFCLTFNVFPDFERSAGHSYYNEFANVLFVPEFPSVLEFPGTLEFWQCLIFNKAIRKSGLAGNSGKWDIRRISCYLVI